MMKEREQKRVQKIVDVLAKVAKALSEGKPKSALKSVQSLQKKLSEKLAKGKKGARVGTKRPVTKFAKFVKDNYKKVAAENPSKKTVEIMKLLGKLYKGKAASASPVKAVKRVVRKSKVSRK